MNNTLHNEIKKLFDVKCISKKRFLEFFDNSDYVMYVQQLYPNVSVSYDNRLEIGFLIKNDLSGPPICKADGCSSYIEFKKGKYRDFCSYSCSAKSRSPESFEKAKLTNLEKYGVDHHSKTEEFIEKMTNTNMEKYGVEHYSKTEDFVNRVKTTNLEKFGVEHPAQSDEIKDKMKITNLERYGVKHYSLTYEFSDKFKNTNLDKYGVEHFMMLPEMKNKIISTNLQRYGVEHPMQNSEVAKKAKRLHLSKFGGKWNSQTNEYKDQTRISSFKKYGVSKPQRLHYNTDYVEIFDDPTLFEKLINKYGTIEFSQMVGCHVQSVHNFAKRHNIKLPVRNQSQNELIIKTLLDEHNIKYQMNDRSIISPLELDFYLPSANIAIEINGLYWHSSRLKDKNYHYNKWKQCNDIGITLFSIFDDDLCYNIEMWKSKILHLCGKIPNQKIYARKCKIKDVDPKVASKFLNENHLQGSCNSTHKLGLYYNDELVSMMTFQNTRNNQDASIDLNRFCTKFGFQVVGGASKLLQNFIKTYGNDFQIVTQFSDNTYSDGRLYETLGFTLDYDIPPDYKYVVNGKREHKANYRKQSIQKKFNLTEDYIKCKSELELMEEQGIYRIYDCGKKKWSLII